MQYTKGQKSLTLLNCTEDSQTAFLKNGSVIWTVGFKSTNIVMPKTKLLCRMQFNFSPSSFSLPVNQLYFAVKQARSQCFSWRGEGGGRIPQESRQNNYCCNDIHARHKASEKKVWNLRSSSFWKCIEIVIPTITVLFCIILNLLRSHQANLRGACAARAAPAKRPAFNTSSTLPRAVLVCPKAFYLCRETVHFGVNKFTLLWAVSLCHHGTRDID